MTKKYVERWDAGCDSRPLLEEADRAIAQLTRERDDYIAWWERDSTSLGKALNEVCSLRASNEQLHAAVKTAQELAATRLMEKDRIVAIGESARCLLAQEIERLSACWSEALGNVTVRNQEIERLTQRVAKARAILEPMAECDAEIREWLNDK